MVSDPLTTPPLRYARTCSAVIRNMLIACPNCTTSYQIEPSSLDDAGGSVRCIRCGHVWFTANMAALSAVALSYRADMAAFATLPEATDAPGLTAFDGAVEPYDGDAL